MAQLKIYLNRLKKPATFASIMSQLMTLLMRANLDVDYATILHIFTGITAIVTVLGILSNPDTQNKGYGEDFAYCEQCQGNTPHLAVGGKSLCQYCGCEVPGKS
ncbi:hypothetical protein [Chakrabartyella piscis]|uniref:hypothetical protein n=1 Tax=Chakrabartyella piscis TaxID=2918914 RepID=UPI00295850B8|nr:hypothetical protein [Chakrabartyella piscis]